MGATFNLLVGAMYKGGKNDCAGAKDEKVPPNKRRGDCRVGVSCKAPVVVKRGEEGREGVG